MSKQLKALVNVEKKLGRAMRESMAVQLRTIAIRLSDGVDVAGDKFIEFLPSTKVRKKYRDGRTPLEGFAGAVIDLPVRIETSNSEVKVSAGLDNELGKPATYQNFRRHFMGFSSEDARDRVRSVYGAIREAMRASK